MADPTDRELIDLGMAVYEAAKELFEACGAGEDFCVQHLSGTSAVFGGTNRVIWSPVAGFTLDASYCTERFKEKYLLFKQVNLKLLFGIGF
ncbi:MAG: hypothetical protein M0036_00055 [Desulfobacteraceae bacterium]|nr:hypothetical protein [Desulfobacteraceae bacterium]